jgi:hypothetical protein
MNASLLSLLLIILVLAAVLQNVYIGGLGTLILVVVLVMFLTGRL